MIVLRKVMLNQRTSPRTPGKVVESSYNNERNLLKYRELIKDVLKGSPGWKDDTWIWSQLINKKKNCGVIGPDPSIFYAKELIEQLVKDGVLKRDSEYDGSQVFYRLTR
jgi:hypothetical protein